MPVQPVKIGIFGNFGIGNFGNEATLEAMLNFLKHGGSEFELTCICTNPERVQLEHAISAIPLNRSAPSLLRKFTNVSYAIQTMRKFDVLIVPGTGILNDYCSPPFGMPYTLFRWCLAAKISGAKLAFVSIGAGPLYHRLTRWFFKRAASMAEYRSYRNRFSKEYLRGMGLNVESDPVYPDLAFALPVQSPSGAQGAPSGPLKVCIGAMHYQGWRGHLETDGRIYENYLGKLKQFALWQLDQNNSVALIMGDERDERAVMDLRQAILAERPSLPEGRLNAEVSHSRQDIMRQMNDADIVIATRFHSLVFALMLGKLTISTGYSDYHAELMEVSGLGEFCQHSDSFNVQTLIAQFTDLVSNRTRYESLVQERAGAAKEALADQEALFASSFLKPYLGGR
jgi:polysaccharide pyruvyl transferase WcaK-like protein